MQLVWNDSLPKRKQVRRGYYWLKLEGHRWPLLTFLALTTKDCWFQTVDQDNGDLTGFVEKSIIGWAEIPEELIS